MQTATKVAIIWVILALIAAMAAWLVPIPSSWTEGAGAFHWSLAISGLYTVLHLGAAMLFLMSLGVYKAKLRRAYLIMVTGIVLVALGVVQLPVLEAYNLMESAWVTSGAISIPFVISGLASYVGIRSMAQLVGVRSALYKIPVIAGIVAAAIVLVIVLPHAATDMRELFFDISNAVVAWDVALYGACVLLSLRLVRQMGAHYTQAMAWLTVGFTLGVAITVAVLIAALTGSEPVTNFTDLLIVASGVVYLKAGHAFARTKEV